MPDWCRQYATVSGTSLFQQTPVGLARSFSCKMHLFFVCVFIQLYIFYICFFQFWVAGVCWSLSQISSGKRPLIGCQCIAFSVYYCYYYLVYYYPSICPSVHLSPLIGAGSWGQQPKQGSPDVEFYFVHIVAARFTQKK